MRYDLTFFLCCCKSFLGSHDKHGDGGDDYYTLLGVSKDAAADEIKRAYKRQSLQMHPDKLAQRGQSVTEEAQAKFTRMKEAYEVLSDTHKRETYDAIGERGMKWLEEPFSIDPQELAHNFATSSTLDRSKIFMIFVGVAVAVLLLPVMVCLHVDGAFGDRALWVVTLVPLWIWDAIILLYHARVIMMGPIPRPEHIPESEWIDPLPMKKRIFSAARFLLIVVFEFFIALKLDNILGHSVHWFLVFVPLYIWELTTLYKKWPIARMRIVTVEDLENALGKPFSQFTQSEKELIGKRYSVVPSIHSPDFEIATKLKIRARHDIIKSLFRIAFIIVLLIQLDVDAVDWNWFMVFMPFWIMTALICYANYQAFADVQRMAAERDPQTFGNANNPGEGNNGNSKNNSSDNVDVEMGKTDYMATGQDGSAAKVSGGKNPAATPTGPAAATPSSAGTQSQQQMTGGTNKDQKQQQQSGASKAEPPNPASTPPPPPLTEDEREELKAQVMASTSRLCSKCCSQCFLVFVVALFVAKLQGAGFSAFWIISPFLLIAGIILCCLGFAIFGITEVPTDGVDFETGDFSYSQADGVTSAGVDVPTTPTTASTGGTAGGQQHQSQTTTTPSSSSQRSIPLSNNYVPPVPQAPTTPSTVATGPAPPTTPMAENNNSGLSKEVLSDGKSEHQPQHLAEANPPATNDQADPATPSTSRVAAPAATSGPSVDLLDDYSSPSPPISSQAEAQLAAATATASIPTHTSPPPTTTSVRSDSQIHELD